MTLKTIFRAEEGGDWAEWTTHVEDEFHSAQPEMLTVRIDRLIEIISGPATSKSDTARIAGEKTRLVLTEDMARWLLKTLSQALERKYGSEPATEPTPKAEAKVKELKIPESFEGQEILRVVLRDDEHIGFVTDTLFCGSENDPGDPAMAWAFVLVDIATHIADSLAGNLRLVGADRDLTESEILALIKKALDDEWGSSGEVSRVLDS